VESGAFKKCGDHDTWPARQRFGSPCNFPTGGVSPVTHQT
jgi:hypothetical protein